MLFSYLWLSQAAQQIIELQEAAQINAGLQPANLGRNTSLHDMKTVVKTWRNRLPIVSDDLSHWSSIFMWRQHHYQGTDLVLPAMCNNSDCERCLCSHAPCFTHCIAGCCSYAVIYSPRSNEGSSLKGHMSTTPSGCLHFSKCWLA